MGGCRIRCKGEVTHRTSENKSLYVEINRSLSESTSENVIEVIRLSRRTMSSYEGAGLDHDRL